MRYGRSVPKGYLPVFSVGTEEEAGRLLAQACEMNIQGDYIARELAEHQTLDNLFAFGDRLTKHHEALKKSGRCDCMH